jgi:hypothetical protein
MLKLSNLKGGDLNKIEQALNLLKILKLMMVIMNYHLNHLTKPIHL